MAETKVLTGEMAEAIMNYYAQDFHAANREGTLGLSQSRACLQKITNGALSEEQLIALDEKICDGLLTEEESKELSRLGISQGFLDCFRKNGDATLFYKRIAFFEENMPEANKFHKWQIEQAVDFAKAHPVYEGHVAGALQYIAGHAEDSVIKSSAEAGLAMLNGDWNSRLTDEMANEIAENSGRSYPKDADIRDDAKDIERITQDNLTWDQACALAGAISAGQTSDHEVEELESKYGIPKDFTRKIVGEDGKRVIQLQIENLRGADASSTSEYKLEGFASFARGAKEYPKFAQERQDIIDTLKSISQREDVGDKERALAAHLSAKLEGFNISGLKPNFAKSSGAQDE